MVEIKIAQEKHIWANIYEISGTALNFWFDIIYQSWYIGINCWNLIGDFDKQKYDVIFAFDYTPTPIFSKMTELG